MKPQDSSSQVGATPEQKNPDLTSSIETPAWRPHEDGATNSPVSEPPREGDAAAAVAYRKSVEDLMKNESPLVISNSQPAHAAILLEKFFKHAKEQVRIFDYKLDDRVFRDENVLREARKALLRGVVINVITQCPPEAAPFLDLLKEFPDSLIVSSGSSDNPLAKTATSMPTTFAVMDGRALRVEQNHETMKAQAAMNRPESAKRLITFFDKLLAILRPAGSTPVPA